MSSRPMRIGDAEREAAASALSEHYAQGRLTKVEYDERLSAVWEAKFDTDLRPLFADLPRPHGPLEPRRAAPAAPRQPQPVPARHGRHGPGFRWWILPLAAIAIAKIGVLGPRAVPIILFVGFFVVVFLLGGRGRSGLA